MRICFVGQGSAVEYWQKTREKKEKKSAVTVFSFNGDEVCYERELKGETHFFEGVAQLSKRDKNLVVCGIITSTHGHRRKSAIVAEDGRILGVSDALHVMDGDAHSGAFLQVYETKIGRVGVAVAEDIYDFETLKTLSVCGCDFIICPFGKVENSICPVLLRAYAFLCGVPILFCGEGYAVIADVDATIAFASPHSPIQVEFKVKKEFHLFETRRKIYLKSK
ncbi:MAG: hypothetical protein E7352_01815 [Clostridiales bacterium]|nr:hypothetical protein [Clostridiales bacterium]